MIICTHRSLPNVQFEDDDEEEEDVDMDDGPPPIRPLTLNSNPEHWTSRDVATFLSQTPDCAHLSDFMIADAIDGVSFMLLNFPTVKTYWSLTLSTAIHLCQHVESVKLAHWNQFRNKANGVAATNGTA